MPRGSRWALAVVLVASVFLVGVLDVVTGPVLDLTVLYLLPIVVGTLYVGRGFGIAEVVLAFFVEVAPPLLVGSNSPMLVAVDGLTHLLVRGAGVFLIFGLARQLREITELKRVRDSELEIARQVQESFLTEPSQAPRGLDVGVRLEFYREVGGDYYHLAGLGNRFFVCLADISGKGVSAALFSAVLNQALTSALGQGSDLAAVVGVINQRLIGALPNDRFVTMFACMIEADSLTYSIAGHERPLVIRSAESVLTLDDAATIPLGIAEDLAVPTATIAFGVGDSILVVTDGVTESAPFAQDPHQLARVFAETVASGAQAVCHGVVEVLHEAAGVRDDVAVVCVQRSEP